MKSVVVLCSVFAHLTVGFNEEPEKSLCLLNVAQRRHQRSHHLEVSNIEFNALEGISLNISQHKEWLLKYADLERTMNNSLEVVERMADEQDAATQKCGQRLQTTKAQLRKLVVETSDFSAKVKVHENRLIEYKQQLNGKEMDVSKFEAEFKKALDACAQQRSEATNDQRRYAKAQGDLKRRVAGVADGEGMAALLQMAAAMAVVHKTDDGWNKDNCLSFLAFLKQNHDELGLKVAVPPSEGCTTKLEEMKAVFTETTSSISLLERTAATRKATNICEDNARSVLRKTSLPMVAERDTIAEHIIESTNSIALMRPVFHQLEHQVEEFDTDVKKTISLECDKSAKVGESLRAIKALMASLAQCPGKDGYAFLLAVSPRPRA